MNQVRIAELAEDRNTHVKEVLSSRVQLHFHFLSLKFSVFNCTVKKEKKTKEKKT